MKQIRVLAGKSVVHTSGRVLHMRAIMGYNNRLKTTTIMRGERGHMIK